MHEMGVLPIPVLHIRAFFALVTVIYFATSIAPAFETDRGKVEKLFVETHQKNWTTLDSVEWDLADNIDEMKLERACYDVEVAINPSQLTSYDRPFSDRTLKEQRMIPRAPILFTTGDKKTIHAKLVNCTFRELKFYLAQGSDDNHVFCLEQDSVDNAFRFRSGLHEINKSGFAD